jgi:hypothetical protein
MQHINMPYLSKSMGSTCGAGYQIGGTTARPLAKAGDFRFFPEERTFSDTVVMRQKCQ